MNDCSPTHDAVHLPWSGRYCLAVPGQPAVQQRGVGSVDVIAMNSVVNRQDWLEAAAAMREAGARVDVRGIALVFATTRAQVDGVGELIDAVGRVAKPVLSIVNGPCLGASLLAAVSAGPVLATPDARLGCLECNYITAAPQRSEPAQLQADLLRRVRRARPRLDPGAADRLIAGELSCNEAIAARLVDEVAFGALLVLEDFNCWLLGQ